MILPDFVLNSRVNKSWEYFGTDSPEHCLNKEYFQRYPHKVSYNYNSRGFRDKEWPESIDELKNAIWCIGDSFTVGVGSPVEHTWPYMLEQKTGRRCINISLDGASNNWIARKGKRIIEEINPKNIVVMWSYFARREHKDITRSDEDRRLSHYDYVTLNDFINFKTCIELIEKFDNDIKHFQIPGALKGSDIRELIKIYADVSDASWANINNTTDFFKLPLHIKNELINFKVYDRMLELIKQIEIIDYCKFNYNLIEVPQLDYARDYHHFDILTSQWIVNNTI